MKFVELIGVDSGNSYCLRSSDIYLWEFEAGSCTVCYFILEERHGIVCTIESADIALQYLNMETK